MTQPYEALLRHFADLRDDNHGSAVTREGKEQLFARAVELLDPVVRGVLADANEQLLLGTGEIGATGLRSGDHGPEAQWQLSWPEQRGTGLAPLGFTAHYGLAFHHPHLRGATVGEWPLNVFSEQDAADQIPTLQAIVAGDLHNLVFQRDFRVVPATTRAA